MAARRVPGRPAGPHDLGLDREAGHRHRPAEVDGDAGQAQLRQGLLERPHEQAGRRPAVAGVGIPRPAGQVGRARTTRSRRRRSIVKNASVIDARPYDGTTRAAAGRSASSGVADPAPREVQRRADPHDPLGLVERPCRTSTAPPGCTTPRRAAPSAAVPGAPRCRPAVKQLTYVASQSISFGQRGRDEVGEPDAEHVAGGHVGQPEQHDRAPPAARRGRRARRPRSAR